MTYTAEDLLVDWISAQVNLAGEKSINYIATYNEIIGKAKLYARDLGIEWNDKFVPEHVWDLLQVDKEFWTDDR